MHRLIIDPTSSTNPEKKWDSEKRYGRTFP